MNTQLMPAWSVKLALVSSFVAAVAGCDGGPASAGDAGRLVVMDSGYDAGVPVCEGTPQACSEYAVDACSAVAGCGVMGTCAGFRPSCAAGTRSECVAIRGCRWEMDLYCGGSAAECSTYRSDFECRGVGCEWRAGTMCQGTPRPCARLSRAQCAGTPGCRLIGAADAGPQDAGDASTPDGGGDCDPLPGDCHPYYDADCGCEYSTSDARYACDRAGSVAEGGSCDGRGQCAAGLICLRGINSDPGECRRRCEADGECGAGERCAFIDDDRSAACTGFCLPVSECSMERQDCPAGEGCYLFPDDDVAHFFCHPEGRGTEEDICPRRRSMACEPGLLCAPHYFRPSSHRCQPLCTTDADCGVLSRCTGETAGLMHCR